MPKIFAPRIYHEDTDLEDITFKYPKRKKLMLERMYGKTLKIVLALLADKIIADSTEQQLSIAFTRTANIENIKPQLTKDEIDSIKHLLSAGKLSALQISKMFGVSRTTIYHIKHDKYKKYTQ